MALNNHVHHYMPVHATYVEEIKLHRKRRSSPSLRGALVLNLEALDRSLKIELVLDQLPMLQVRRETRAVYWY